MRIIIVTGLAGGGKTTCLRALEDIGFFCCDNLPIPLFTQFIESLEAEKIVKCAISVDGRQLRFFDDFHRHLAELREAGHQVELLFLEAPDAVLFRRYSETRRKHPLSGEDVASGILLDRDALSTLRDDATVINTGGLNVHEIKQIITQRYQLDGGQRLAVNIQSFGFKFGLPSESEIVFDVRYLPNPHFDAVLGPQDGRDRDVADYVFANGDASTTADKIEEYLRFTLPLFEREGKVYVTLSIGCTGGRHRSVALVEELAGRLGDDWYIHVRHRDLAKSATRSLNP